MITLFRRWMEYDAATRGLRALVSLDEYRFASRYARGCDERAADVVRYVSTAVCYGLNVQRACALHARGVPATDLLGIAEAGECAA